MSVNTVHRTGPRFIQTGNIRSISLPIKLFLCQPLAKGGTVEIVFLATRCACPCLTCRRKGMLYFYCCKNAFKEKPLCFPLRLIIMFCRNELHTSLHAERQIFPSFYFECRVCMHTHVHMCTCVAIHTCECGYACVGVHMEITWWPHVSFVTVHLICGRVSVFLLRKQGWPMWYLRDCGSPDVHAACQLLWGSSSGTHIYVASAFDPLICVAFYFSPLPHPPFWDLSSCNTS